MDFEIDVKKPHDSFFKGIFGDISNTRDFLKSYLPQDLVKKIDFDKISISDTEKEDVKYKKSYLDLSVTCEIDGKKSKVYIIFEHKSYKDRLTLIQILSYCLVVWEKELNENSKNLTVIIPFIFYHGRSKSKFQTNFRDYFDVSDDLEKYLLNFKMLLFDTATMENNEIKKSVDNLFLASVLLVMKNIHKKADDMKEVFEHILNLDDERVLLLWRYIITKKDMTEEKFDEIMVDLQGEPMKSIAEIWQERGRKEGELKGELIGKLKEIHEAIKFMLKLKFQAIGDNLFLLTQKIDDIDKLKKIQKSILKIDDAEEFRVFVEKTIELKPKHN